MFADDVAKIEQLAAQQPVAPKPEPDSGWKTFLGHGATALIAVSVGLLGGSRLSGNDPKGSKPQPDVTTAPAASQEAQKPLSYAEAVSKAKSFGLPLVVGVQTATPMGDWVTCKIPGWSPEAKAAGWVDVPQFVVFSPKGTTIACLPASATSEDIAKAIKTPPDIPMQYGGVRLVPSGGDVCIGGACRARGGRGG